MMIHGSGLIRPEIKQLILPDSVYDEARADHAIDFFQHLRHIKGRQWASKRFQLIGWQEWDILRPLFGVISANGWRQFQTIYVEVPKKNGKTELAGGIVLLLLVGDGEYGAEVYGAAVDRDQARQVYDVVLAMVAQEQRFSGLLRPIESQRRLVFPDRWSFYQVLSADVPSKHGLNVHGMVVDELHAYPNRKLFDVLTEGSGAARLQPVFMVITTAGDDESLVWQDEHDYAVQVAKGIREDPTYLPVLYYLEDDEDWENEDNWRRVNPSLGHIFDIEELRRQYNQAKGRPAKEANFRRLRLNQKVAKYTAWIKLQNWDASAGEADPKKLVGQSCYAGLDMSSNKDITALVLVFVEPDQNKSEWIVRLMPFFWIPGDNVEECETKNRADYRTWIRRGLLIPTPGDVVDYTAIKVKFDELARTHRILQVGYDKWGMTQLSQDLADEGMKMVEISQGFAGMGAATKEFERMVLRKHMFHGGNPVLRWMLGNTVVKQSPEGIIRPDKEKSRNKIDGIVAAIMGLDCATRQMKTKPSVYEGRGLIVLGEDD
jgi:phage terminase large subunit-like protein